MKNYLLLAKKLKKLADKGTGGEKVNAEKLLDSLMRKHGISKVDLEDDIITHHYFKVDKKDLKLFQQVSSTLIGSNFELFTERGKKGYVVLKTTAVLAVEIDSKYLFYKDAFDEEYKVFLSAFIRANNLYPCDSHGVDTTSLTPEKIAELRRTVEMSKKINSREYHKSLGEKQ